MSDRRAVAGVWVAFSMVLLLGVTALALDAGLLYVMRNRLQATADAAALAGAIQLPDEATASTEPLIYADKNMPFVDHGTVLDPSDVVLGNWQPFARIFTAAGDPINAVQVTTRKAAANGNPVNLFFAKLMGYDQMDVSALAIAAGPMQFSGGGKFILDAEVIDTDIPVIEDLAFALGITPDTLIGDANDDWFLDIWDHCMNLPQPEGCRIELPTGQLGDEGLWNFEHPSFPFNDTSDPTFVDFLNWNDDSSSWRYDLIPTWMLDPLLGVSAWDDPSEYASLVDPNFIHVSPVYKSDTGAVTPIPDPDGGEIPAVNALGWRRGMAAFKIIGVGADPDGPGSVLPNLIFEFVNPAPFADCLEGSSDCTLTGHDFTIELSLRLVL
ncbi:MAG: TadG family pilus assembly protein [Candidatus Neomarinimicrobiota bacterium]